MNYILFDDLHRNEFLPLTYTRPVSDLLIGIYTNRERWELYFERKTSSLSTTNLSKKFPIEIGNENLLINGRLLPDNDVFAEIMKLNIGQKLICSDDVLAIKLKGDDLKVILDKASKQENLSITKAIVKSDLSIQRSNVKVKMIKNLWDYFTLNGEVFTGDIKLMNKKEYKSKSGDGNQYFGNQIYIHKNARVNGAILNSNAGPIVIEDGAEIMEGSLIRGPFFLGKHASVKMGAKIYGPTSIGDHCKVGGEVNNSVINAYSNKGHDGFLGNSVVGSWCNLGADTNNSNLKNDYSIVKLWNYKKQSFVKSGLQFLGLIMGDHSKCGINTMFNTGTVVGVSSNIYGSGFQPNFIPSFSWGKPGSFTTYQFEKAMQVAQRVMERRSVHLDGTEEMLLKSVFDETEEMRSKFH